MAAKKNIPVVGWDYAPSLESTSHIQLKKRYDLFIGGKWVKPSSGKYFETINFLCKDIYIDNTPNQSARTYATLIIEPAIDEEKQKNLIASFNKYLQEHREKYNSLFLTNYRESKDIARKRISFDLVYSIAEYLLDRLDSTECP